MATLVLGAAGAALGGSIGGTFLGVGAATLGGFIGSTIGSVVDSWIVSSLAPTQRIEGQRLDSLRLTSSSEGSVIPRLHGRMRLGGTLIWATDFREETRTTTQGGGKGGGRGGKVRSTEYLYYASFAVALCEGSEAGPSGTGLSGGVGDPAGRGITGIGRIWADGKPLDPTGLTWRWYPGDETQMADPFIAARMGAASTPAYRGTAYVVFEDLPLASYGNRLPQLSFEVFRPLAEPDTAEGLVRAVAMLPAAGEFALATEAVRGGAAGAEVARNLTARPDLADFAVALDGLQAAAPEVGSVTLGIAWFGTDLRAGNCQIWPGVEAATGATTPWAWSVNGIARAAAHLISRSPLLAAPAFGGTPADIAVVQAIRELKARGLEVTLQPRLLMDIPPGNTLPSPYVAGTPAFRTASVEGGVAGFEVSDDGRKIHVQVGGEIRSYDLPSPNNVSGMTLADVAPGTELPGRVAVPPLTSWNPTFQDNGWNQPNYVSQVSATASRTSAGIVHTYFYALSASTDPARPNGWYLEIRGAAVGLHHMGSGSWGPAGYPSNFSIFYTGRKFQWSPDGRHLSVSTIEAQGRPDVFHFTTPFALGELAPAGWTGVGGAPWMQKFGQYGYALDRSWSADGRAFFSLQLALGGWGGPTTYAITSIEMCTPWDPATATNAGCPGQPAYPGCGRITCTPAAGIAGSVDKTPAAAAQVAAFFGAATPASFAVSGETVAWTGPANDRGLRRMVLHYAHLGKVAGGVDAFVIGSGLPGLTTIRAGAADYPAVTAFKALAADVRAILGPGAKIGYAADAAEWPCHRPADGSNDLRFPLDPLWADPHIDFIGVDTTLPLSDWRDGFEHADALHGWPAIHDRAYLQSNIRGGEGFDWTYARPTDRAAQIRTPIADPAHGKPWVFRPKDLHAWWSNPHHERPGGVESATPTAWVPQSKPIRFTSLGCPAIDRGTNQPGAALDPKSSESALPHHSRGWRDDAIQRACLEASLLWWGASTNNPVSALSGAPMVDLAHCAARTWDARPWPFFPAQAERWADAPDWRLGPWLTGRLGAASLAALVRQLCRRAGLADALVDVSGLWGAVEGHVIAALESPRASLATLARHFGFDAIETEGVLRFVMRGRAAVATLSIDELVADREGEALELTRGQETELPQALTWQVARADEDYDTTVVEARRITVDSARIATESFPMAVPPEEAERRCRRALMEAWIGRESATFRLPPSWLALDPSDVVRFVHDGRETEFRLVSVADTEARGIEAVRQDRAACDLPPGAARPAAPAIATVFGRPEAVMLDLPRIREDQPAHRPLVAAHASPWPGEIAVYRSAANESFDLVTTFDGRARIGTLALDLAPGPTSRFDLGARLVVDLRSGTLESVTDLALFGGANALAVESALGQWEIVQASHAELIAAGRYRLTRLLRGQRGTEHAMGNPAPVGARVVVLDDSLAVLPIAEADLGLPWTWRIGPAIRAPDDASHAGLDFTPMGRGLLPFAPVHVAAPWRTARIPGDLTIRWTRRSRAPVADAWEQVDVPLDEAVEAYEIEIRDGPLVRRTLTSATPSVLYSAAQQTADWGAPLGPGQTLAVRIFQLSARLGRGTPATVTLQF